MCIWYDILNEYPNGLDGEDWDYKLLSKRICFKCMREFNHKPWSPWWVSLRDDLPFYDIFKTVSGEFVLDLGESAFLTLNKDTLAHNANAPWDFVDMYKDDIRWVLGALALNPNIPFEDLKGSPEFVALQLNGVLYNKSLPLDFLEKNIGICIKSERDMEVLSSNPILTKEFVSKYPNGLNGFPWNLRMLAKHLPLDFITSSEIFSKADVPRRFFGHILLNPSITKDFFEKNPNYMLEKYSLQLVLSVLMEPALFNKMHNYTLTRYEQSCVARHKNFPLEFFKANNNLPHVTWDLNDVCKNPNLTWGFVKSHLDGFLGQRWSSRELSHQKWVAYNDERRFKRQKGIL